MKRVFCIWMALLVLACAAGTAEGIALDEKAKQCISVVNYFAKQNTGVEQLFVSYQEVVEGEIFGFAADGIDLQALMVGSSERSELSSASFITDTSANISLALNCGSLMPFCEVLDATDEETAVAIQDDMIAAANWIDENYADVMTAFRACAPYSISYAESDYFRLDVVVAPLENGARMMASYYFDAAQA